MDIIVGRRNFHLAQEIVDKIAEFLSSDLRAVANARLLCTGLLFAFEECVPTLCPAVPSELFPLSPEPDAFEWPPPLLVRDEDCDRLLTWTWIDTAVQFDFESQYSHEKYDLGNLLSPPEKWLGNVSAANDHRMRTSWGYIKDRPRWLCIAQLWPNPAAFAAYRSSKFCKALGEFLEQKSPGCTKTALSEWAIWPNEPRDMFPFQMKCNVEIRTIFFPATMTAEQIKQFEERIKSRAPEKKHRRGRAKMWWVPGIHSYKGRPAIAARLLIKWTNDKTEEECHEMAKASERQPESLKAALSDAVLEAAGAIGVESEHCFMKPGRQVWWKAGDLSSWYERHDECLGMWKFNGGSKPPGIEIPGVQFGRKRKHPGSGAFYA